MIQEAYPNNPFAQKLHHELQTVNFGASFELVPVTNDEIAHQVHSVLKHLDHSAKLRPERGYATVYDGLAFDSDRLRSQAFAIYRKSDRQPVAVSAMLIAPRSWIEKQRYFEKKDTGVVIADFKFISQSDYPDFLLLPGWTYVDNKYLLRFALSGFHAISRLINLASTEAPIHTWMMEIPRGLWPRHRWGETEKIASSPVGTHIPVERLPFSINLLGTNDQGANASVKMSRHLGLQKINNMASVKTLGPIFAKSVK